MAALLARGAARFDPKSGVIPESPHPALPPVLAAVLRELAPETKHRTLVRAATPAFAGIHDELAASGLIFPDQRAKAAALISAGVPVLVALFGCAKIAVGVNRGRPVGDLVFLVIMSLMLALLLAVARPFRTAAGRTVLRDNKSVHARAMRAPMKSELPLAVALGGAAVLSGTPFAAYAKFAATSDSGSSGGDGGGGDGGGGGCGGCSSGD